MIDSPTELGRTDNERFSRERIENLFAWGTISAFGAVALSGIAISKGFEHGVTEPKLYIFSAATLACAALSRKFIQNGRRLKKTPDRLEERDNAAGGSLEVRAKSIPTTFMLTTGLIVFGGSEFLPNNYPSGDVIRDGVSLTGICLAVYGGVKKGKAMLDEFRAGRTLRDSGQESAPEEP